MDGLCRLLTNKDLSIASLAALSITEDEYVERMIEFLCSLPLGIGQRYSNVRLMFDDLDKNRILVFDRKYDHGYPQFTLNIQSSIFDLSLRVAYYNSDLFREKCARTEYFIPTDEDMIEENGFNYISGENELLSDVIIAFLRYNYKLLTE